MKQNSMLLLAVSLLVLVGCVDEPPSTAEITMADGTKLSLECQEDLLNDVGYTGGGTCYPPKVADYDSLTAWGYSDGVQVTWTEYVNNQETGITWSCTTRSTFTGLSTCPNSAVSHDTGAGTFTFTDFEVPSNNGLEPKIFSGTMTYYQG